MITGGFLSIGLAVFVAIGASLFPTFTLPEGLTNVMSNFASFLGDLSGIGAWLPWKLTITCASTVLALWIAGFLAKLLRVAISHIPGIGGKG